MINLQLKEKYSDKLNALTVIYPNFNQKGLGDILYRKILKQNPLIALSRLTSNILQKATLKKLDTSTAQVLKFNVVYPYDKRWTKQPETTITVKTVTIQDYLAGFDIIDYKYDVKYADALIEILNSGVFGPLKCTAFDAYYDAVTVTLDMTKIHPLPEYNTIANTPADTLYHLINQQPFIIHFIRAEKREIDKESNPTTIFRGDGVVKIPSEALLEYWG